MESSLVSMGASLSCDPSQQKPTECSAICFESNDTSTTSPTLHVSDSTFPRRTLFQHISSACACYHTRFRCEPLTWQGSSGGFADASGVCKFSPEGNAGADSHGLHHDMLPAESTVVSQSILPNCR